MKCTLDLHIDLNLLKAQKEHLVKLAALRDEADLLDGLVCMLDAIQDQIVDTRQAPESAVFQEEESEEEDTWEYLSPEVIEAFNSKPTGSHSRLISLVASSYFVSFTVQEIYHKGTWGLWGIDFYEEDPKHAVGEELCEVGHYLADIGTFTILERRCPVSRIGYNLDRSQTTEMRISKLYALDVVRKQLKKEN